MTRIEISDVKAASERRRAAERDEVAAVILRLQAAYQAVSWTSRGSSLEILRHREMIEIGREAAARLVMLGS